MIVLDASFLIAYLNADDEHHEAAETLLASQAHQQFAVNPMTLAEVLVGPARVERVAEARELLAALDIRELTWSVNAAVELARLRATTRLKMPDCCVLLSALDSSAAIATFDRQLAAAAYARNVGCHGSQPAGTYEV